jgi:hypothetical protein
MSIPVLQNRFDFGSALGQAIGQGFQGGFQNQQEQMQQQRMQQQQSSALQKALGSSQDPQMQLQALLSAPVDIETKKLGVQYIQKQQEMQQKQSKDAELQRLLGGLSPNASQGMQQPQGFQSPQQGVGVQPNSPQVMQARQQAPQQDPILNFPDEQIAQITAKNAAVGQALRMRKDAAIKNVQHQEDVDLKREKAERDKFESERSYHTQFSKEAEKEAEGIRSALPRLEMALDFARNAVETGKVDYFSPDKLADATGIDLFRTAKGAQLITAGKENLLGNMSRVSARAQNQWFEQRLNSMFPKIGQSKEANLTTQEMLEGEAALNNAYLKNFDRLSQEDMDKYGFVKKDISKRAHDMNKFDEKEILQRTTYRMKEIEEQEKGLSELKKQVGKTVTKDTPLTLAMAKLYKEKYGKEALKVAEKNGYYIPTLEEFQTFQKNPREFREKS